MVHRSTHWSLYVPLKWSGVFYGVMTFTQTLSRSALLEALWSILPKCPLSCEATGAEPGMRPASSDCTRVPACDARMVGRSEHEGREVGCSPGRGPALRMVLQDGSSGGTAPRSVPGDPRWRWCLQWSKALSKHFSQAGLFYLHNIPGQCHQMAFLGMKFFFL